MFLHLFISSALIANAMAAVTCPATWSVYTAGITCVKILDASVDFAGAKTGCANAHPGGKLVDILDSDKNAFVAAENTGGPIWLGMTDENGDKTFLDSNGNEVTYDPFGVGHPEDGLNRCVIMVNDEWNSKDCTTTTLFRPACEIPAIVTCDIENWFPIPGTNQCVRVFKGRRNKKSYDDANSDCADKMGSLATHVQNWSHIKTIMGKVSYKRHMWIGVNNRNTGQVATYVDGTAVTGHMPFKQERGLSDKHHCAALKRGKWYGKRCSRKFAYACQRDA